MVRARSCGEGGRPAPAGGATPPAGSVGGGLTLVERCRAHVVRGGPAGRRGAVGGAGRRAGGTGVAAGCRRSGGSAGTGAVRVRRRSPRPPRSRISSGRGTATAPR